MICNIPLTCILFIVKGRRRWSARLYAEIRNDPVNELAPGNQTVSDMCTHDEPTARCTATGVVVQFSPAVALGKDVRLECSTNIEQCIAGGGGGWHYLPGWALLLLGLHTTSSDAITVGTTQFRLQPSTHIIAPPTCTKHHSPLKAVPS